MRLSQFGLVKATLVLFIGELLKTNLVTSEGEPYYSGMLVTPVTVRCSVDKSFEPIEDVDELLVRERDALGDAWVFVDEEDTSKGYYIPDYKTDFSKGQEACIYQETTIAEWARGNRKNQREERDASITEKMKARAAQRAAIPEAVAGKS